MTVTEAEVISLLKAKLGRARKGNGNWVNVPCPTCLAKNARKMKRGVNLDTMTSSCFICNIPLTLDELTGCDLGRLTVDKSTVTEEEENPLARTILYKKLIPLSELPQKHPAIQFMVKDHLTDFKRYDELGIGYVDGANVVPFEMKRKTGEPWTTNIGNSIYFPVFSSNELVGWQVRYLDGRKMKYLQLFPKGRYLYNYDNVKQFKTVVVVEGVKKALKFPNAVATWGKGLTPKQIQLLMHWENIIFLYDGEDDTQEKVGTLVAAYEEAGKNALGIDPRKYGFPSPDEMTENQAQSIVYHEWQNKS